MVSTSRYNGLSIFIHWAVALLFLTQFVIAETGMELNVKAGELMLGFGKYDWYGVHKSIGVSIFVLVALRMIWRFTSRQPKPIPMPKWDLYLSRFNFILLYIIMVGFPLSGYIMSVAGGHGVKWFWLFDVPNLIAKNQALAGQAHFMHEEIFPIAVYVVVGLHVTGALYHFVVRKDNVLWQMLPLSFLKK